MIGYDLFQFLNALINGFQKYVLLNDLMTNLRLLGER